MLINGKIIEGNEKIKVLSPYSGAIVGEVARCGPENVETVISTAAEGFRAMLKLSVSERAAILEKASAALAGRKEEFAKTICLEVGKTITEARGEVDRAIGTLKLSAGAARNLCGETIPMDLTGPSTKFGYYKRVPLGITLAITPFNFPLNLACHKVGPAIAAGNSMILKPASKTPLSSMMLGELLIECGLPAKAITVVCGPGESLGNALVADKRVKKVSFTGSYDVGEEICRTAGMKKVTMELGSSGAMVVTPDTDISAVAAKLCAGGFGTAGQVCISVQRVYAHETVKQVLIDEMKKIAESIPYGDPMDDATRLGPMISESALKSAMVRIDKAISMGAKLITGNRREGSIFVPTILTDAPEDSPVISEEMFAPVITVNGYKTLDEAIQLVNNNRYGLQAGIFSNKLNDTLEFAEKAETGGVIINDCTNFRLDNMPYGGIKDSGLGKEGPEFAIKEMTEIKMIVIDRSI